jgi:hypothetical protein
MSDPYIDEIQIFDFNTPKRLSILCRRRTLHITKCIALFSHKLHLRWRGLQQLFSTEPQGANTGSFGKPLLCITASSWVIIPPLSQ